MGFHARPNSGERASFVEFKVPQPITVLDLTMSDGAMVRVRRHGKREGPRLILSHGNGFAIDAYFPFWRHFLHDCEVIVFDQRNHGWNPRHHASGHTERQMAEDMETILRAVAAEFGERRATGAFHSLSTTVSLLHAMRYEFSWDALILFDPPLAPPPGHPQHAGARDFELTQHDRALQRNRSFSSVDQLAASFKASRRMQRWVPGAAELMARAITRTASDGGIELVCPPEFEASIYLENANSPAWAVLPELAENLLVISSDYDAPDAAPPALVCKALQSDFGIQVVPVRDTSHFLQIERPEEVQRLVRECLRSRRPGLFASH
jgi:pimeloyl-ACP methyl ester carboxylesterase